jgi:2-(1,2-epoxy-1,2-dihydrophenyl)acetyl-CoA isomerase
VVPAESFAAQVAAYADRLAAGPPVALALTKRLLAQSPDTPLEAQLRDELAHIRTCFGTRDVAEAMTAFREKRAPTFVGR